MNDPSIPQAEQVAPASAEPTPVAITDTLLLRELYAAEQRAVAGWRDRALLSAQLLENSRAEIAALAAQIEEMKASADKVVEDAIAARLAGQPVTDKPKKQVN